MLAQLRQRKLIRYALGYTAAAAALFGGLATVGQVFDWPDTMLRAVFYLLVAGFFVTLVLAWFHGEQGRQRVSLAELALLLGILTIGGALALRSARTGADRRHASAGARSVAVLPFVNMSGSAENEYFSDGITEEVLNALASLTDLRISARTSSFSFKGRNLPVKEIARQLGVGAVVQGSVRRTGDRVRISVQLIDAGTDQHLWSEQYDRDVSDIFAVQTEIARRIAEQLNLRLHDVAGGSRRGTRDPSALDAYLRGLAAINQTYYRRGRDYFMQAVARDSAFALAYAGLSDALSQLDQPDLAKAAARRAVLLDDRLAEAHTALAYTLAFNDWKWEEAEREFTRALELRPGYTLPLQYRAYMYNSLGRNNAAIAAIEQAQAFDPLSLRVEIDRAYVYMFTRNYARAIQQSERVLELDPGNTGMRALHARAVSLQDGNAKALPEWLALGDSFSVALARNDTVEARAVLRRSRPLGASSLGSLHARLGEADSAFVRLEAAARARHRLLPLLAANPDFDNLRSDPRYQQLLRRMGIILEAQR